MIYPLTLDTRMSRIAEHIKLRPLQSYQMGLYEELRPLIRAMQYLRTTALHGVVIDIFGDEEPFFHLRSKNRMMTKSQLFACEDLINHAAHVTQAFRISLGEKDDDQGHTYTLPDRPPIPEFLPDECRTFPKSAKQA